jgi:hypothetical protein
MQRKARRYYLVLFYDITHTTIYYQIQLYLQYICVLILVHVQAIYRPITLTSQPAADDSGHGTQFTSFTGTIVQILTQLRQASSSASPPRSILSSSQAVLMLLLLCRTTVYMSWFHDICVLILLYVCRTAVYVSSYHDICVLILVYVCRTAVDVSWYHDICVLIPLYEHRSSERSVVIVQAVLTTRSS